MIHWKKSALLCCAALMLPLTAFARDDLNNLELKRSGLMLPEQSTGFATGDGVALPNPVAATPQNSNSPVTLEADAVGYDVDNGIAIARGHVVVVQGEQVLTADKLTYFQQKNLAVAEGNVSVLQPTGEVFFADRAELKDDLQQGVIHAFKARMSDNSVFAAAEAHKPDRSRTILKKAVYTPCNLCETMEPFWQVKASKMTVDEKEEEITYRNARMEMFGIPMLYTPYLSQPTPDAGARSGFLTPEYSTSSNLGQTIKAPYYWHVADDKDLLLTPWFMSDEGVLLQGQYRQLTDHGDYDVQFSGTNPDKRDGNGNPTSGNEFRGHIYAKGEEQVADYSRVGFDINRATDDTYLRRYGFGAQRVLFSRLYGETAEQRNFGLVQGLSLQGLRATDNPDTTPLILPTVEGYYETEPMENGLRFHAFGDAQSLTRDVGADQHRLSGTMGASLPYIADNGMVVTTTGNLRQDVYNVQNVVTPNDPSYDGTQLRTIPQAALEWRYPLINSMGGDAMTIEPIVLAVAQPNGSNPSEIPNEDNTLIELTDTNLFALDRMPGLDSVDSGSRAAYGFRTQYLFEAGESIDGLFGQNYSFSDGTPFPNSVTPGQNASDYIGRIGFNAQPVTLTYRFAFDHQSMAANRNEVTLGYTEPWMTLYSSYRSIKNNRYLRDSEEGTIYASVPVTDEWTPFVSARRDMELNQMIATSAGLIYHNECFSLMLQALRNYTRDRDIEPDTQVTLRVGFKNLGEFGD